MDAVLDEYALEMLGAAIRKDRESEVRASLPAELRDLCDRLKAVDGPGECEPLDRRH